MNQESSNHLDGEDDSDAEFDFSAPNPSENRRSRFRLRFPRSAPLAASIGGMNFEVVEIAEHSLVVTTKQVLNADGKCSGVVYWSNGDSSPFTGEMGRLSGHGRVIWNIRGITTGNVLKEQRRLLKIFPETSSEQLRIEVFNPDG